MVTDAKATTTIQVSVETWKRIQKLKVEPGISNHDVIRRLLDAHEKERAATAE